MGRKTDSAATSTNIITMVLTCYRLTQTGRIRLFALFCLFSFLFTPFFHLSALAAAAHSDTGFPPVPVAFIYGYNNSYLIAQVQNATVAQVAYTSFETTEKGYWQYSGTVSGSTTYPGKTGTQYYSLATGAMSRTNLPAGRYVVSYWTLGSASVTVGGTNLTQVRQKSYN